MKKKGFIKLLINILTKPGITDLVNEEGAVGFGVYIMVVLYLAQCDDSEGAFTNGQLYALAVMSKKSRAYIRHIICDYGLFEIEGRRFHELIINQYSHARSNMYAGEDIDEDKEKEKKKKFVRRDGTHSEFETVRAGRRYASHGQPLPGDAPPQRHRNHMYSYLRHDWVPAEEFDKDAEMIVFHKLFDNNEK